MENPLSAEPQATVRALIGDSIRFWEIRRRIYKFVLCAVVIACVAATWPHFRPMFDVHSLLLLAILGSLANACHCAASLVDIPMQFSALGALCTRRLWALWLAGMLFAVLLASYWIADKIYPFVH